jgi:hypothetical protein
MGSMRGIQIVRPQPPGKPDDEPKVLHIGPVVMASPGLGSPPVVMLSLLLRVPQEASVSQPWCEPCKRSGPPMPAGALRELRRSNGMDLCQLTVQPVHPIAGRWG